MGAVYRAVHEKLGRPVGIKVLHRSMLSDRTNIARFFQEARTVNTIRHPNVVDIYDFVAAGKDIYMVMEFLSGRDVQQALAAEGGKGFLPERAVAVLEQMLGALHAAHERKIIHRDLKPANVFLINRPPVDEFVKLLDFGLAKFERLDGRMTRDGVVLGTPEYMAPEQARGDKLDARTDVYAVGCLAYEMLTGTPLFSGAAYADILVKHIKEAPRPPREIRPELPAALEDVVLRALSKLPEGRPASAQAMAEELAAAVGRPFDASGAFAEGKPRPGGMPVSSPAGGPSSGVRVPALYAPTLILRSRSIRELTLFGVALMGLLALVASVVVWRKARVPAREAAPPVAASQPSGPGLRRLVAVKLQSTPPGAEIVDDKGAQLGVTNMNLVVPLGSALKLRFLLEGFQPHEQDLHADFDMTLAVVMKRDVPAPSGTPSAVGDATGRNKKRVVRGESRGMEPQKKSADLDSRAKTINPFGR